MTEETAMTLLRAALNQGLNVELRATQPPAGVAAAPVPEGVDPSLAPPAPAIEFHVRVENPSAAALPPEILTLAAAEDCCLGASDVLLS